MEDGIYVLRRKKYDVIQFVKDGRCSEFIGKDGSLMWSSDVNDVIDNLEFVAPLPTPPKVDEPKGHGAVVEATCDGLTGRLRFTRFTDDHTRSTTFPWITSGGNVVRWDELDNPVVLSEGLQDEVSND